jgi:hypothetical protein
MQIVTVAGANHYYGKTDDYLALRVRIDPNPQWGMTQTSAWEPTPDELARLNAGAKIHLIVCGTAHPPVALTVGHAPFEVDSHG